MQRQTSGRGLRFQQSDTHAVHSDPVESGNNRRQQAAYPVLRCLF